MTMSESLPIAMPGPAGSDAGPTPPPQPQHTWSHPSSPPSAWPPIDPALVDRLDPRFVRLYNEQISKGPPPSTDIHTIRENFTNLYGPSQKPPTGVGGIGEVNIDGWPQYPAEIRIRVYVPPGETKDLRERWPVHFNFHSGAYAVGDLNTDAHLAHHICAQAQCCVVDVAYRLIPEVPFGVGIMDSFAAVMHVLANRDTYMIDETNVTLGGTSSGGSIALILNHLLRDAGHGDAIQGVIVGTPIISDVRRVPTPGQSPWQSMTDFQNAPLLDFQKVKFFDTLQSMSLGRLSPRGQRSVVQWFAELMNAPNCNDLAKFTFVATAEIDPRRDEAEGYAEMIKEAGNEVVIKRYPRMPHQFMYFDQILPQGQEYVDDVVGHVRRCLYPKGAPQRAAPPAGQSIQNGIMSLSQPSQMQCQPPQQMEKAQSNGVRPADTPAAVPMSGDMEF